MAEYKVIQDIEAEDKLLGPFTLRQFIYAAIVVAIGFIDFQLLQTKAWFMVIPLLPPLIFFMLLAAPFGRDQSSEIWLLAKVRFFFFTKKRIWDQEGIEHLVTITVPKKIEHHYSDGLSKSEVKSRLKTLASTMDTRGWIVKNVVPGNRSFIDKADDDRLLQIQKKPEEEALASVKPASDILDTSGTNPLAANLTNMVDESELVHRQELLANMQNIAQQYSQPIAPTVVSPSVPSDDTVKKITESPKIILDSSRSQPVISPIAVPQSTGILVPPDTTKQPMTPTPETDIIDGVNKRKLSTEIDVKQDSAESTGDTNDEVVISLH